MPWVYGGAYERSDTPESHYGMRVSLYDFTFNTITGKWLSTPSQWERVYLGDAFTRDANGQELQVGDRVLVPVTKGREAARIERCVIKKITAPLLCKYYRHRYTDENGNGQDKAMYRRQLKCRTHDGHTLTVYLPERVWKFDWQVYDAHHGAWSADI